MPLAPGVRLGAYEIVALIGAGGMGEVYRARDARLARDVAIKVLPAGVAGDPERLQRFEQEARAAAALNHPNILAVHDLGPWQVSTAGGSFPRWRRDGKEIFYLAPDGTLMAASVNGRGSAFEVGAVRPLFRSRARTDQGYAYDVSADGRRAPRPFRA